MTTDSNPQTIVLLFSEKASQSYITFEMTMTDGTKHCYNYIDTPRKDSPNIIPYFHDAVVVATVDVEDIALKRGTQDLPDLNKLVEKPSQPTQCYHVAPSSGESRPVRHRTARM